METVEIVRLYCEERLSYRQIGTRLGMHYSKIRRVVVKVGAARTQTECKQGALNPAWRGGTTVDAHGYVRIKHPEHPHADKNGYVKEHRFVMEQQLGRYLDPREHVHHRDGNRSNNAPENLELLSQNQHSRFHALQQGRVSHCCHGHEMDAANTYVAPDGRRQCRACSRAAGRRYQKRRRAEVVP